LSELAVGAAKQGPRVAAFRTSLVVGVSVEYTRAAT